MEATDVANMDAYFGRQLTEEDYRRLTEPQAQGQGSLLAMTGMGEMQSEMDMMLMGGGDTLDDIVMQNQKEILRRRTMQQSAARPTSRGDLDSRRGITMMEFAGATVHDGDLAGYQFAHDSPAMANTDLPSHAGGVSSTRRPHNGHMRRPSTCDLALDTQFTSLGQAFNSLPHREPYDGTPLNSATSLGMSASGPYDSSGLSAGLAQSISLDFPTLGLEGSSLENVSSGEVTPMNHFAPPVLQTTQAESHYSQMQPDFSGHIRARKDPGGGSMPRSIAFPNTSEAMTSNASVRRMAGQSPMTTDHRAHGEQSSPMLGHDINYPEGSSAATNGSPAIEDVTRRSESMEPVLQKIEASILNATTAQRMGQAKAFKGIYSSSGFDMLNVLMRVATRPNPEINIGAVDMSCAFVVCDVSSHDFPIIYCSDNFERLTGYTKHEILGRNCRFLQAPDGKVQSGAKRRYVDDEVVLRLKQKISQRREAQTSLINYRKGGQPFMNLLTVIPIRDEMDEVKYFVGFQVDLVETPQSVTNKNPDGSYAINYQRGFLPRYVWQTPENNRGHSELGQTIPRDDVSTVLSTISTGESELSKRIWDKVLLENTDDVVHVLSLKGLFLYLSPSSRKVLEYDSSELVGTALSSVCHPSDIVPVTRELKDTSTGVAVNVVFRIRRKHSGYTWFESHGSLHTEQGKGRKCIILVGRERPVYALSRHDIVAAGGIGENELWTKLSTSGMFLYVSSSVKVLLDRQPEDLVGTSMQALMRPDSKKDFGKVLEKARTGKIAQLKHEMQNKRGQVLQAQTTLYPGDAVEGQKPTFLVAQTRLLKLSRTMPSLQSRSSLVSRTDLASAGSASTTNTARSGGSSQAGPAKGPSTPLSSGSVPGSEELVVTQPGGSGLPIGTQDMALASEENVFDELKTTRSTSWQFELRQMEKRNRLLAEELQSLLSSKKKRKRRKGAGQMQKDCANCHTRVTPEWRRGPSGSRDLCNSCGLRWAKQNGRVSPRTSSQQSRSPAHSSPRPTETLLNLNSSSIPLHHPSGSMAPPDLNPAGAPTDSTRKADTARAAGEEANKTATTRASMTLIDPFHNDGQIS